VQEVFFPSPGGGVGISKRIVRFKVPASGAYRIGWSPSSNGNANGSVLIGNPQVERDDVGTGPTKYQATDGNGNSRQTNCASTPAQLRARFVRRCETQKLAGSTPRCFYETRDPMVLSTPNMSINGQSLAEVLASDNYNYRHLDFAINLVGTGVRNCDENPTPSCYASGTIDFDLRHEAHFVPIIGFNREVQRFPFSEGAIRSGKALTYERYLTLPLSGADTTLLATPGVSKTELKGRPLDGRYYLRIYESPALRWNQLEDVQLVMKYKYWSRVLGTKRP
jgi:hypothetical protein